jgi:diacylglycerol kinase (ATP)
MSLDKWVFIINPVAGNGFAAHYLDKLKAMIEVHSIDADLVFTERMGHASELSESYAKQGYRYIIGVGGDGTMNEICRPLIGRNGITTGLIPAGTGNDFIQILGFPDRLTDAHWDTFFMKNAIGLDVGSCNGKIFLNGMGLGFDAEVAAENYSEDKKVKKGGKSKYIWHILKTLLFYREKSVIIQADQNKYDVNCFINTIAIGRRFAGGFFLTPQAIANDGLLDVCMIRKLNLFQRLQILLMVPKGTHIFDKKVNYYKTKTISLDFNDKVPFHVDGELFFDARMEVKIIPAGLNVIYNPEGKHFFNIAE